MRIFGLLLNLLLKIKNGAAITRRGLITVDSANIFFSVPATIYNGPGPERASGFLFPRRHKKHISNSDHPHGDAVVKDLNEKNYDHPFNPDQRA